MGGKCACYVCPVHACPSNGPNTAPILFTICMRDLHKILCHRFEFGNSPVCGFWYFSDAVSTSDCVVINGYMQVGDEL
jgi:hypothetical protein